MQTIRLSKPAVIPVVPAGMMCLVCFAFAPGWLLLTPPPGWCLWVTITRKCVRQCWQQRFIAFCTVDRSRPGNGVLVVGAVARTARATEAEQPRAIHRPWRRTLGRAGRSLLRIVLFGRPTRAEVVVVASGPSHALLSPFHVKINSTRNPSFFFCLHAFGRHGQDADAEGVQADGEEGVIDDEELPIAPAFPENVPVVTTTCGDFEGAIRSLAAMYSNVRAIWWFLSFLVVLLFLLPPPALISPMCESHDRHAHCLIVALALTVILLGSTAAPM